MAAEIATRPPLRCRIPTLLLSFLSRSASTRAHTADPAAASSKIDQQEKKQQRKPHRLASVVDAVNDRKLPPELRSRPNAIRSESDIVNVVEQRIWRSMEEGHFENLPGKGKPLDLSTNPHADPAEDTLYRILSRNGCAPEWVELNKEIRCRVGEWRAALKRAWESRINCQDSLSSKDSESLKAQMHDINSKVLRYNLMVYKLFIYKWANHRNAEENNYNADLALKSMKKTMRGIPMLLINFT